MFKARLSAFGLIVLAGSLLLLAQSSQSLPFSIPEDGAALFVTTAVPNVLNTGLVSIHPDAGIETPSAFAKLGIRANGILTSETTIPAMSLRIDGRNFVEVRGPLNTGIVIANPSDEPATISVNFSSPDIDGFVSPLTTFIVPPRSHLSRFITEPPFNTPTPMQGQFRWLSSVPVSVIAVRCLTNERSELIMTSLLEPDPRTIPPRSRLDPAGIVGLIPHFVDGAGWSTEIVMSNDRTDEFTAGTMEFFDTGQARGFAQPQTVTVDGESGSTFTYELGLRRVQKFLVSGSGSTFKSGSVRITTNRGFQAPSVMAIFRFARNGVTVSETSVPMMQPAQIHRIFVNESGDFRGQLRTAVAIENPSTLPLNVELRLTDLNGRQTGLNGEVSLPPLGEFAGFLTEIPGFAATPFPFHGVLEVSVAPAQRICVVGFYGRYNQRLDFLFTTALPRSTNIETSVFDTSDAVLPLVVNGGGFTSEFVLLGGGLRGILSVFSANSGAFGFTRSTN